MQHLLLYPSVLTPFTNLWMPLALPCANACITSTPVTFSQVCWLKPGLEVTCQTLAEHYTPTASFFYFCVQKHFSHYDFTEDLLYVCSCLIGFIFPAHTHNNNTRVCKFNKGRFLINSNEWHEDRTGDYGCLCCQTPTLWLTCLTHSYTVFLPGCSHLHSSPCTAMYTLACVSLLGSPFLARVCLHSPLMWWCCRCWRCCLTLSDFTFLSGAKEMGETSACDSHLRLSLGRTALGICFFIWSPAAHQDYTLHLWEMESDRE